MKIRNRWLIGAGVWCIVNMMRLLYATCRKTFVVTDPQTNAYEDLGDVHHLYSVWHDQILMVLFAGKPLRSAGLVSRHQDGGLVADVMRMRGIRPVRGSTSRGGAQALKQLLKAAHETHVTITPDGPRGPRHVLKPGIVFIASHSGRKIVPLAFTCKRYWAPKGNWTDMMVPYPFTRVYAFAGEPVQVPADLTREEVSRFEGLVQKRMEDCEVAVERLRQGESVAEILAETASESSIRRAA